MNNTIFPEIQWEKISSNGKPDKFKELYQNYLLPKSDNENWSKDTLIDEDNINLLHYAASKLTSVSIEERLKETDSDIFDILLYSFRLAYLFTLKKQYKDGLYVLNWTKINLFIKDVNEQKQRDTLFLFGTVLYYFLKQQEEELTQEDINFFSYITYGQLNESVHFKIERQIFKEMWKTELQIGAFFGWAFQIIEKNLNHISDVINVSEEEVVETYLINFTSLLEIMGINKDEKLMEGLNSLYQHLSHPFLQRTIQFLMSDEINIHTICKYIRSIRKDSLPKYQDMVENKINSLFQYINKSQDYLVLLEEIDKKPYLISYLHMVQESDNVFEFGSILEELINVPNNKGCPLALKIYNDWLSPLLQARALEKVPFYMAYLFQMMGLYIEAKELYEKLYKNDENNSAVINNLAVIYYRHLKEYEHALALLEKGKKIQPNDDNINSNIEKVLKLIEEQKRRPKEIENRYFKKIDKLHRKILFAIHRFSDEEKVTDELLQSASKLNDYKYFRSNMKKLMDLELVTYDGEKGYVLDPIVYKLIQDYIDPKMEREVVRASTNKLYRPIFYHESEIRLYEALIGLFPQQLVFPNMDLKTIIDVSKIKSYLDTDVLDYMYKAHVDFAIISNTTYLPILCIEKDSNFQDNNYGAQNAVKKNVIFNVSGLPLIRVRFTTAMDQDRLKEEVKQATKELLLQTKLDGDNYDILKEFDLKRFGIVDDFPSLEKIRAEWMEIVGDVIYSETKDIQLDNNKATLFIYLSKSIEKIVDLGKDAMKSNIYQRFPMLNSVQFVFV